MKVVTSQTVGNMLYSEGTWIFDLQRIKDKGILIIKQPTMLCNLVLLLP